MSDQQTRQSRWYLSRLLILAAFISVPFGIHHAYKSLTALPDVVSIATGVEGGRYRAVMESLGQELQERAECTMEIHPTSGTLENIGRVLDGDVHFALIQSGVEVPASPDLDSLRCVGNIYSETVLLVVRTESGVTDVSQLEGRPVSLGLKESGDYAAALEVLDHIGLSESRVQPRYLEYSDIVNEFRLGTLDAAIVAIGLDAEVLATLAAEGLVQVMSLPFFEAFATHRLAYHAVQIPAGTFQAHPFPVPDVTINTVAVTSQLITRNDVSNGLVKAVTGIVMDQRFQRDNKLRELFSTGADFARHRPSHPLHGGAIEHYEPELKPLLPPDFVEATEGMRSFVVSSGIAIWLFLRWYRDHRTRTEEHRLDQFIRQLVAIETRQMDLDETVSLTDIGALQDMLDEVTRLRQEALGELTAQELNDDPAAGTFLDMCHALSEKISAKLTRQRFDVALNQLADRLVGNFPGAPSPNKLLDTPGD